nr:hypothetical protein 7 [bacterium]
MKWKVRFEIFKRLLGLKVDPKFVLPTAMHRLDKMDQLIVAIKAIGGYKFRKMLKATDKEVERFALQSEIVIRSNDIRICVAEALIRRAGYWSLYKKLEKEVDEQLTKEMKRTGVLAQGTKKQ